jgi:hypothetical protein
MHEDNFNEAKFGRCRTAAAASAFTETDLLYQQRLDLEFPQDQTLHILDDFMKRIYEKVSGNAATVDRE